jgi:iron complex transport system ATP-binding protein
MTASETHAFRLEAQRLQVKRGDKAVLVGVSLAIGPGEVVGILGPNGAGKSTLLATLAGLLQPTHGFVALDGRPLADFNRNEVARAIAFLPQKRVVHWSLSARATVELGRFPYAGRPGEMAAGAAAIDAALAATDVATIAGRSVDTLSGGELARVLMARALAQDTPLLLADEPTAGLDPSHQLALFEVLTARARSGRSVLVAIHDLALAARFCTRLVMLLDGTVLADGPPASVLTEPLLRQAFAIEARLITVDGAPLVVPVTRSGRS